MLIAIDDGYRTTVATDGQRVEVHDTLMHRAMDGEPAYEINGARWSITSSDDALDARRMASGVYHASDDNRAFVADAVLGMLGESRAGVDLIVGLPVGDFLNKDKVAAKTQVMSTLPQRSDAPKIKVKSVKVRPQGASIVSARDLEGRFLIIDVGSVTTDIASGSRGRGRLMFEKDRGLVLSEEVGTWTATQAMLQSLGAHSVSTERAVNAFRDGVLKRGGQSINCADHRATGVGVMAERIMSGLAKFPESDNYDIVLVLGGGGDLVIDRIRARYPQAELASNPLTANAEAFYELGA